MDAMATKTVAERRAKLLNLVQAHLEHAGAGVEDVMHIGAMLAGTAVAQASGRDANALAENIETARSAMQITALSKGGRNRSQKG